MPRASFDCIWKNVARYRYLVYNGWQCNVQRKYALSHSVELPDSLINDARLCGDLSSRSVPQQIEYWSRIGKMAEANPELPFGFVKQVLESKQEAEAGKLSDYEFG